MLPGSVLPEAGNNPGLPQQTKALPDKGVLPRQGTSTKKPDDTAPKPPEKAAPKPKGKPPAAQPAQPAQPPADPPAQGRPRFEMQQ